MRLFSAAALSLLLTAGAVAVAPPALAAGMVCSDVVSARLDSGGGSPNYITVENCGTATASWRYNLNNRGWTYVSIGGGKQKTTNFPASWAKLDIQFTW
ncbi:hypothetical protein ACOZ38_37175 [Sphaerisporangium viridialbum]|uniref:hypothetical protein n=1 Tax=Sphaerisporangium viridialbum TaxID=46189 RepID=UPI003C73A8E9